MDQNPLALIWERLRQTLPAQMSQGFLQAFSAPMSPADRLADAHASVPTVPYRPVSPINPALLDNGLHPYDQNDEGSARFDRYREDEPGVNEWIRQYGSTFDEGSGTAPAVPPSFLERGAQADRRGELPDPVLLEQYMRAKYGDIHRI